MALGVVLGTILDIDGKLANVGAFVEKQFTKKNEGADDANNGDANADDSAANE